MKIIHRSCCAIRRGFTFIEALTVASGVSVLLALLVPAVQNARDSERDVLCLNRLKQLGLALHNYHDSHLTFPPGWVSRRPDAGGYSSTGWHNQILPYVNQGKLYSVIGPRDGLRIPTNEQRTLLQTAVVEFRCNSDSVGEMNPLRGDWGTTNYMGNFGPQPIPRWSESDFWPEQINNLKNGTAKQHFPGIFNVNSSTNISQITDGTSQTLLVGERSVIGRSGIWPEPRSNFHESDVVADGSYASPLNHSDTGFSSRHSKSVINFVLCDGSARSIHESVNSLPDLTDSRLARGIFQKLAGENDGMVVGGGW
jgi:type II secretory pathway pseudopilin PulG